MNQNKKYCRNCGNEMEINSKFCSKCGTMDNSVNNIQQNNNMNNYNTNQINNPNYNAFNSGNNNQEFNWATVGGIACAIVSLFIFWWLSAVGLSIEIKALKEIKEKNQKGRNVAYIGIALCSAGLSLFCISLIVGLSS